MNAACLVDFVDGLESPPIDATNKAKAIYKLKHRYKRLVKRADAVRGMSMNLAWMEVAGVIFECLGQMEAIGVDVENDLDL